MKSIIKKLQTCYLTKVFVKYFWIKSKLELLFVALFNFCIVVGFKKSFALIFDCLFYDILFKNGSQWQRNYKQHSKIDNSSP